jgi:hypothetical protein
MRGPYFRSIAAARARVRVGRSHWRRGADGDEGEVLSRVQEPSTRTRKEGVEWEEGGESVVADSRFEEAQG